MSVLKKIGTVLLKAGSIATEIMGFPFIGQLLGASKVGAIAGTVLGDFSTVAQVLSLVEAAYPTIGTVKTGSKKLQAAAPIVEKVILQWAASNLPGHNKVKDAAAFSAHAKALTSAFADVLNDFGE
jgi:hypothetical protein